jgi:hypothetical protein
MSILTPFDSFNISKEIQKLKTENSEEIKIHPTFVNTLRYGINRAGRPSKKQTNLFINNSDNAVLKINNNQRAIPYTSFLL